MNKKGFTLIELLSVVTLIALISLIVIPNITENVNKRKNEISDVNKKLLTVAADAYIQKNGNKYAYSYEANGSTYCIPVQSLIDDGVLTTPFKNVNGDEIDYSDVVKATYEAAYNGFDYELVSRTDCTEVVNYVSRPVLSEGMIPVVYEDNVWKKADVTSKWYNYSDQKWANAVLVNEAKSEVENSKSRYEYTEAPVGTEILESDILSYFVWVPRFRYKLFDYGNPTSINIVFESVGTPKARGTQTGEWLTHPAFTINNQELSGIWVSKYEASNQNNNPIIKANQIPWTSIDYNSANEVSISMTNINNMYGLNNVNTHLIRNSEWSAVAYLTHSKYGFNNKIDASTSTTTGNSNSTTGNITGIYDMSGVSKEFVILDNENENSLGYSLSETNSWYSDTNTYPDTEKIYLTRGQISIFNYSSVSSNGTDTSFRVSLINNNISSDNQIVIPIANEIDGVKYYDTAWINNTPIYFNPTTGEKCTETDYNNNPERLGKNGCMIWYAYSENADGTINMLLDHNTSESKTWAAGTNANGPGDAQGYVLYHLREDTINWQVEYPPKKYESNQVTTLQHIDYSALGIKARLIEAEEVANIVELDWTIDGEVAVNFTDNQKIKYGWLSKGRAYWTSTPNVGHSSAAWLVYSNISLTWSYRTTYGVRPVITVSKNSIF